MEISVINTIKAERDKVWDYYTDPQHITQWNFATPEWQCPLAENDLQIGGKYLARMEAKDGSFGFNLEGTYDAIIMGESFTYTMTDGRPVSVNMTKNGVFTDVVVTFKAEEQNDTEMQKAGWQAILDNFKKYTEAN